MMRRVIALNLGILSAGVGMLIALPTITYNNAIWLIQMLLSEFAWLSTFIGVVAVALGTTGRRKSPWGVALGITGIVWSLVPYWLVRRAAALNDDSMREGLGDGYMQHIPPMLRARIAQARSMGGMCCM